MPDDACPAARRRAVHRQRQDVITVVSPYDGSRHRRGACLLGGRRRAGGGRRPRPRTTPGPLPLWRRAEILDRAAARLTERREEFAAHHRRRGGQADQDGAGRGRACRRHLPVRRGRGPQAGRRDDPARRRIAAARASSGSRCACRSAWSARSARSTSRSTSSPTSWRRPSPPAARSCSSRPARRRSRPSPSPSCSSTSAGCRAEQLQRRHRRRRHRRQRHRRPSRRRPHHLHRLARGRLGHPGACAAQARRPRARQQRPGDHRARRRLEDGGRQDPASPGSATPARAASPPSGSTCTARSPTTFTDALAERVRSLVVGDPLDEAHRRVGAHLAQASATA